MRILVVDDNTNSLQSMCLVLNDLGHESVGVQDPLVALEMAQKESFHLIISDIRMPGMDGLTLLSKLKKNAVSKESDVVIVTGHGDMNTVVEALRRGAYDYLSKPINARELSAIVTRSAERQALVRENKDLKENLEENVTRIAGNIKADLEQTKKRLRELEGVGQIISASPIMQQLLSEALILHGEPTVPVLIEGETGTGKEIFAKYIHYGNGNISSPYIAINCSAIPHDLFESELFGHEAGAFTGSKAEGSIGRLEQAEDGTLFLDEVAEMPLSMQPKLLRVLEERTFYRLGSAKKRTFNARIICAGNRDMHAMVEAGLFRRDLYHRLRVGHIVIPPLRERKEDISQLAEYFLQREATRKKKKFSRIDADAMRMLLQFPWPGNVRELENTIERAVLMQEGEVLLPAHIDFLKQNKKRSKSENGNGALPVIPLTLDSLSQENIYLPDDPFSLASWEEAIIHAAMEKFKGNKSNAAKYLGISRFALHRKLQRKM